MKNFLKSLSVPAYIVGTLAASTSAGCYIHPCAFMVVVGLAIIGEMTFLDWYYKRKRNKA